MAKRDYYEVLGVGRDAGADQIKAAYRKAARKFHPDVNKAANASEKFREASEAYEVLSDPQKRRMYDQFGHAGPQQGFGGPRGPGGPGGFGRGRGGPGTRTYTYTGQPGEEIPIDFEDIFGGRGGGGFSGMSLDEILEQLRGGAGRRGGRGAGARGPAAPVKGEDVEYDLTLDFMEAIRGTTATLRMDRGGQTETIKVKIPPGVDEGSRVRARGQGGHGEGGAGDLYIVTHIRPHAYFKRDGADIYITVPISIVEAALGAKIEVPTIDGMTTVTVPQGAGASRKLRLRGKGVAPVGKPRGDQYITLEIVPPPKVSAEGAELLHKFEQVQPFNPRENAPWK